MKALCLNHEIHGEYGPYMQSKDWIYKIFCKKLIEEGKAYPCFMSSEELRGLRKEQERMGVRIGYYGKYAKWRDAFRRYKEGIEEGKTL
jgi:glutamyl-tRNA synthetase